MQTVETGTRSDRLSDHDGEIRDLMVRYQNAEPAAVDALIRRLSPTLLSYFSATGFNSADREDLLQECWLRVHRSRHTYRSTEPVLPWIFAIARHTRLDALRRRWRRQGREVAEQDAPERYLSGASHPGNQSAEFEDLIAKLPESQREVIVMLKVSGMTVEEIARATGTTAGAVKQKAHRAYEKLRLLLGVSAARNGRGR